MTSLTLLQALALGLFAFSMLTLFVCGAYLIAQELITLVTRAGSLLRNTNWFDTRWKQLTDVEHKGHGND